MFTTRARVSPDLIPFCKPFFFSSVMEGYGRRQRVRWMENDCVEQSCLGGLCSLSLFLSVSHSLSLSLSPSFCLSDSVSLFLSLSSPSFCLSLSLSVFLCLSLCLCLFSSLSFLPPSIFLSPSLRYLSLPLSLRLSDIHPLRSVPPPRITTQNNK